MNTFQTAWMVSLVVMVVASAAIGWCLKRDVLGILIDARCRLSLSRLQTMAWTIPILSAICAAIYAYRSLNITVPTPIWALMGISVASVAGTELIKGNKSRQEPTQAVLTSLGTGAKHRGVLTANAAPKDARLGDLFMGDEVLDDQFVDITKVQMFFFSLALLLGYASLLWSFTPQSDGALAFPEMSPSLVTLLGISHTGYLTVKAAPKTPTA